MYLEFNLEVLYNRIWILNSIIIAIPPKAYPDILPMDIMPTDVLPRVDYLPTDILPRGQFTDTTFCRQDIMSIGRFAEEPKKLKFIKIKN